MITVNTLEQARETDQRLEKAGITPQVVEEVGAAVARASLTFMGGAYGRKVIVEAGPGNNGADGKAAGRFLSRRGAKVVVASLGEDLSRSSLEQADLYIDAAFGVGLSREYFARRLPSSLKVLAIDILSGVDATTGMRLGDPLRADVTVAVGSLKPGHLQNFGMEASGVLKVVLPELAFSPSGISVPEDSDLLRLMPTGVLSDHKWKRSVMVIAGSEGMTGAAQMTSAAAYRLSGGIVHLLLQGAEDVAGSATLPEAPEIVLRRLDNLWAEPVIGEASRFKALIVGPGIGRGIQVANFIRRLISNSDLPTVIDADGLYAFQGGERLARARTKSSSEVVITPHEGEFEAVFGPGGLSVKGDVDRIEVVREASRRSGCIVLLKGAPTVICAPSGETRIVTSGSSLLAMAGSGDTLSGIIGGLLARGMSGIDAASLGSYLHGRGGALMGGYSITPSQVLEGVVRYLGDLKDSWHESQSASKVDFGPQGSPRWANLI